MSSVSFSAVSFAECLKQWAPQSWQAKPPWDNTKKPWEEPDPIGTHPHLGDGGFCDLEIISLLQLCALRVRTADWKVQEVEDVRYEIPSWQTGQYVRHMDWSSRLRGGGIHTDSEILLSVLRRSMCFSSKPQWHSLKLELTISECWPWCCLLPSTQTLPFVLLPPRSPVPSFSLVCPPFSLELLGELAVQRLLHQRHLRENRRCSTLFAVVSEDYRPGPNSLVS